MGLLVLAIIVEKFLPRCQIWSLVAYLWIVTASLCRAFGMSSACSSLLLARVNAKVQLKECEGWKASSGDCYCNQKTAQVRVPKSFEGMPARTHVSNYHMQSRDSVQVALSLFLSKWKEWWGRDKGGEASRPETAPSCGSQCQPGRRSWPPTHVHPWSQGSTVPTLRAPLLPIYFELQGNQLIRLEEVPYSEAIWLAHQHLIEYKDWVDSMRGPCIHQ